MFGNVQPGKLYKAVFELYSDVHVRRVTLRAIVKAASLPADKIYYWYGDMDTLYRLSVKEVMTALSRRLDWTPEPGTGPREAVLQYTAICADLFETEEYGRLLYMVVRDGRIYPWLAADHRKHILEAMESNLARLVRLAGRSAGSNLDIRASGRRRFVDRLQAALAMQKLLPGQKSLEKRERRLLLEAAGADALAAVYTAGFFSGAIAVHAPQRTPDAPAMALHRRRRQVGAEAPPTSARGRPERHSAALASPRPTEAERPAIL
jgi:hypothetical protein